MPVDFWGEEGRTSGKKNFEEKLAVDWKMNLFIDRFPMAGRLGQKNARVVKCRQDSSASTGMSAIWEDIWVSFYLPDPRSRVSTATVNKRVGSTKQVGFNQGVSC